MANHQAVTLGGQWGFFELNTMMPLIGHNLLESIELLGAATANFATQCVAGLQGHRDRPAHGGAGAGHLHRPRPRHRLRRRRRHRQGGLPSGRTVRQVAREQTSLSDAELERLLDPAAMTEPGLTGAPMGG